MLEEACILLAVANATNRFEEHKRLQCKEYINAEHREEIIFTKGATEALLILVANTSYGEKFINKMVMK